MYHNTQHLTSASARFLRTLGGTLGSLREISTQERRRRSITIRKKWGKCVVLRILPRERVVIGKLRRRCAENRHPGVPAKNNNTGAPPKKHTNEKKSGEMRGTSDTSAETCGNWETSEKMRGKAENSGITHDSGF